MLRGRVSRALSEGQINGPSAFAVPAAVAAFEALCRFEGIIPALESAHALGALPKMHFNQTDVVVLTVSGRGDKDMETYLKYFKK